MQLTLDEFDEAYHQGVAAAEAQLRKRIADLEGEIKSLRYELKCQADQHVVDLREGYSAGKEAGYVQPMATATATRSAPQATCRTHPAAPLTGLSQDRTPRNPCA